MNFVLRSLLVLLLVAGASLARAQRTLVPVVESNLKPLTGNQVRQAIIDAGVIERLEVAPVTEGVRQGTFVKQNRHTVVVTIRYPANRYSLTDKDFINMKAGPLKKSETAITKNDYRDSLEATEKQHMLFVSNPESRYAVAPKDLAIHPFYEAWARRMLDATGRQLKLVKS